MNGRIARLLRKKVYGDDDFRERHYGRSSKTGAVINLNKEEPKKISKRMMYQKLKKGYNTIHEQSNTGSRRQQHK